MRLIIIFAVFLLTFTMIVNVSAQRCPASKRTIKIYVQNGHQADGLSYRLIPLKGKVSNQELLSSEFLVRTFGVSDPDCDKTILSADRSVELNSNYVAKFVKDLEPEKEQIDIRGNKLSGKIKNGELIFNASDLNWDFYLLEINSSNYQTTYLLGRILGGCSDIDTVILRWPVDSSTVK
ncbi:MAG: hypothetical protein KF855_10155 [Acidobacteria bacterium]|nr:hypothetical protein [Acidobacteriota bacterium]